MDMIGLVRRLGRTVAWVGLALAALSPHHAQAADAAAFFKGKTVRIVVGYSPGGGYDALARLITHPLEKRLGATVIVENKPGAGGLGALNSLTHDNPDGLRTMLLNGEGAALAQIVDLPGMKFDMATLGVLARVSYENRILLAGAKTPFHSIDGFEKATSPVVFGSGGRIDGMGDMAQIFCRAMKIPCKLVIGYPGSNDVTMALRRGEVNAQVTSESQTAMMVRSDSDIGRVLVLPPKVPAERAQILEAAFRSVLTDPAVIAEGERTNRPLNFASAGDTRAVIKRIISDLTPDERKEIKELILHGY